MGRLHGFQTQPLKVAEFSIQKGTVLAAKIRTISLLMQQRYYTAADEET
jgi:hypothetical protein